MVTVCRPFSFVPLIYELSGYAGCIPTGMCLCRNCALHLKCAYLHVCSYVSAHYEANVSVYSMCVWLVLAAWVMRGVRPECMAWFSQHADESWQLQDCLLLLVGPYRFRLLLPITFMVTARLCVYIYIHGAAGKTFHLCKGEYWVASVCPPILLYCHLLLTPQPAFS